MRTLALVHRRDSTRDGRRRFQTLQARSGQISSPHGLRTVSQQDRRLTIRLSRLSQHEQAGPSAFRKKESNLPGRRGKRGKGTKRRGRRLAIPGRQERVDPGIGFVRRMVHEQLVRLRQVLDLQTNDETIILALDLEQGTGDRIIPEGSPDVFRAGSPPAQQEHKPPCEAPAPAHGHGSILPRTGCVRRDVRPCRPAPPS